jgi:hypothetical protein
MAPASRCRVWVAIRRVTSSSPARSLTARRSRPPPAARSNVLAASRSQLTGPGLPPAQRPASIGQQPPGFRGSAFSKPGQLTGDTQDCGLRLAAVLRATQSQPRRDHVRTFASRAAAVAHPGAARAPAAWIRRQVATIRRIAQQPRIGRVGDVGRHNRSVGALPAQGFEAIPAGQAQTVINAPGLSGRSS